MINPFMNGSRYQIFTKFTYPRHHQGWFSPQDELFLFTILLNFFGLFVFFYIFANFFTFFLYLSRQDNLANLGVQPFQVHDIDRLLQGFPLTCCKTICPKTIFGSNNIWTQSICFKLSLLFSILLGTLILFQEQITKILLERMDIIFVISPKTV